MDIPAVGNAEATLSDEIPSLLLPIADGKLLLPTVSVAEMLPYKSPQKPKVESAIGEIPEWYIGDLIWRGIMVPMISFEVANGEAMPTIKPTSQIAVLNSTANYSQLPFICFPTQGIPRLSRHSGCFQFRKNLYRIS